MPILRERVFWKRDKKPKEIESPHRLTPKEQDNVRAAIVALRVRHKTLAKMAELMKVNHKTLEAQMNPKGQPTPGLAIRLARLAGVGVDDVIYGRWPKPGCCPYCGRCG